MLILHSAKSMKHQVKGSSTTGLSCHQESLDEERNPIIASLTGGRDKDETQTSSSYDSEYSILHIPQLPYKYVHVEQ